MYILTEKNIPLDINSSSVNNLQNLNFCVFDLSCTDNDYYFYPLLHILTFNSKTYICSISGNYVTIPSCYNILIGEPYSNLLEFVNIEECMHRDFEAFIFNPLSSYKSLFAKIEIISVSLNDHEWFVPKIKNEHILLSPVSHKKGSNCIFLINNSSRIETIELSTLL